MTVHFGEVVSSIYRQWAPSSVMVLIFVLYSNWMKKWIVIFLFVFCVFVQCVLINLLDNSNTVIFFSSAGSQSAEEWRWVHVNNWAEMRSTPDLIKSVDFLEFTSQVTLCVLRSVLLFCTSQSAWACSTVNVIRARNRSTGVVSQWYK